MSKLSISEQANQIVEMFTERGIYKTKVEVVDAALHLLLTHHLDAEASGQSDSQTDLEAMAEMQLADG
jgi:hypothetical protein